MKKIEWKNYINYIIIAVFTIVFAVLSLTGTLPSSTKIILEKVAISIILAVSLSMVVGFLGELSLGHAGFMCVGAYLGGKFALMLQPLTGKGILTLIAALIIGGIAAAVCGFIIGLPALRLRGDYLAIVTLAFGEIVKSVFENSSKASFGGAIGMSTGAIRFDKDVLFIIAFVLVILCLVAVQNIIRSKHGRAITAIRDNEIAAKATGINVTKYKLIVFAISSFFAGIAGVLFSFSNNLVKSGNFDYNYSIEILVMVVLGGMGNINGAIIAAALISFLDIFLQQHLTGNLAVLQDFLYALILIVLVIYNNAPALKGFREKYNFAALLKKIKLMARQEDPAKRREDEAKWDRVPTKIEMNEVLSVDLQVNDYTPDKGKKEGK